MARTHTRTGLASSSDRAGRSEVMAVVVARATVCVVSACAAARLPVRTLVGVAGSGSRVTTTTTTISTYTIFTDMQAVRDQGRAVVRRRTTACRRVSAPERFREMRRLRCLVATVTSGETQVTDAIATACPGTAAHLREGASFRGCPGTAGPAQTADGPMRMQSGP